MKNCLSDNALVALDSDDGSEKERDHLESCLNCARRYRELSSDLETIVAVLKQPAPALIQRPRLISPRLGWSLAAAAIVLAFVCGRITAFGGNGAADAVSPSAYDSADSSESPIQWQEASNSAVGPASFALYISDLLAQDEGDQNSIIAGGNGEADSDEM